MLISSRDSDGIVAIMVESETEWRWGLGWVSMAIGDIGGLIGKPGRQKFLPLWNPIWISGQVLELAH